MPRANPTSIAPFFRHLLMPVWYSFVRLRIPAVLGKRSARKFSASTPAFPSSAFERCPLFFLLLWPNGALPWSFLGSLRASRFFWLPSGSTALWPTPSRSEEHTSELQSH